MKILNKFFNYLFVADDGEKKEGNLNFRIDECKNGIVRFQFINTRQTHDIELSRVLEDTDYIIGLHPIEACYLGVEFELLNVALTEAHKTKIEYISKLYRFGELKYLSTVPDLSGDKIRYKDIIHNEIYIKCPIKLSKSLNLIDKFDPAQAFVIGIEAQKKINHMIKMKEIKSGIVIRREKKRGLYVVE